MYDAFRSLHVKEGSGKHLDHCFTSRYMNRLTSGCGAHQNISCNNINPFQSISHAVSSFDTRTHSTSISCITKFMIQRFKAARKQHYGRLGSELEEVRVKPALSLGRAGVKSKTHIRF